MKSLRNVRTDVIDAVDGRTSSDPDGCHVILRTALVCPFNSVTLLVFWRSTILMCVSLSQISIHTTESGREYAHSDDTASLVPFGSTAMARIATPTALVTFPCNVSFPFAYCLTSLSSLPVNQQSFYHHQTQYL